MTLKPKYKRGLTQAEQRIAEEEIRRTMKRARNPSINVRRVYSQWISDARFLARRPTIPRSKATLAYISTYPPTRKTLESKARASGIPYTYLRKVFERGMAAWRSGHRPGISPQQWAMARVNSFITGIGKARHADRDIWTSYCKKHINFAIRK